MYIMFVTIYWIWYCNKYDVVFDYVILHSDFLVVMIKTWRELGRQSTTVFLARGSGWAATVYDLNFVDF